MEVCCCHWRPSVVLISPSSPPSFPPQCYRYWLSLWCWKHQHILTSAGEKTAAQQMQKKKNHLFYSGEFWLEKYKRSCSSKCMAEWRGNVHLLLSRTSTGQLALLVQEVQHAAQDGQEEKADDDDHDHHAAVIDWRNREQQHDCTRCQYSTAMSTSHNNSKPRFFFF